MQIINYSFLCTIFHQANSSDTSDRQNFEMELPEEPIPINEPDLNSFIAADMADLQVILVILTS